MNGARVLWAEEIRRIAPPTDEAVDRIADGFVRLAAGEVRQPPVLSLAIEEAPGEMDVKTAHVAGWSSFCLKVSTGFFRNPERDLPSASGLMVVLSAETGRPLAILLDEGYLTDLRTALAGAVAARALARQDARHAAILGAGAQARWQLRALARVRALQRVSLWARRREAAEALARDVRQELDLEATVHDEVATALADADVVVTTTPSHEPLLTASMLRPGMHVTAMGADAPGKRELEPEVLHRADVLVVDEPDQSRSIGELQGVPHPSDGGPDPVALGAVLAGTKPGRAEPGQITVCDLTGTGVQDTVIARWVLERANDGTGGTGGGGR